MTILVLERKIRITAIFGTTLWQSLLLYYRRDAGRVTQLLKRWLVALSAIERAPWNARSPVSVKSYPELIL